MTRTGSLALALVLCSLPALAAAQVGDPPPPPPPPPPTAPAPPPPGYAPGYAPGAPPPGYVLVPQGPARQGFTWALSLGIGWINISVDGGESASELGLGGLNLALGGFVSESLAILFKISGATVSEYDARFTAGIAAGAIQYWAGDVFRIEAGLGLFFVAVEAGGYGGDETAPGIYLSPGVQVTEWGSGNSLQIALEYTAGFFDGVRVDALGFVLAYQGF